MKSQGKWLQLIFEETITLLTKIKRVKPEMCSERDSPLKRLYRRTHAKLTRLAGSRQLV